MVMFRDKTDLALYLSVFLLMIGIGMMVPLLPQRVLELTGEVRQVGYLASAFAVSYVVLQVPFGNLADRYGFKWLLVGGYVVCGLTGLLYFSATHVNTLFLGRALQGVGEVPIWALAPALLTLLHPKEMGRVVGLYNGIFHIGLTIGPLAGLWITQIAEARTVFLIYTVLCLLGGLLLAFGVKPAASADTVDKPKPIRWRDVQQTLRQRSMLVMFLGIVFYGAGYAISLTGIPAYLITQQGMDEGAQRLYFTLIYVAISFSQIVVGRLAQAQHRLPLMIGGLMLAAVCLLLLNQLQGNTVLLLLTIASLGFGVFHIAAMARLNASTAASMRGTISGMFYLFWGIGYFAGPALFSAVSETSFSAAFQGFAVLLGLAGMMLFAVRE